MTSVIVRDKATLIKSCMYGYISVCVCVLGGGGGGGGGGRGGKLQCLCY